MTPEVFELGLRTARFAGGDSAVHLLARCDQRGGGGVGACCRVVGWPVLRIWFVASTKYSYSPCCCSWQVGLEASCDSHRALVDCVRCRCGATLRRIEVRLVDGQLPSRTVSAMQHQSDARLRPSTGVYFAQLLTAIDVALRERLRCCGGGGDRSWSSQKSGSLVKSASRSVAHPPKAVQQRGYSLYSEKRKAR